MLKKIFLLLLVPLFYASFSSAQCKWKNIDSLIFQTPGVIDTGINAAEVYHTSPQTYGAHNPHTGDSLGLYFNVQNSVPTGWLYHRTFATCIGGRYQFSFYYKSYSTDVCLCDFTVNIYDSTTLISTSSFSNVSNSVWTRYISPTFISTKPLFKVELLTNISTSTCNGSGNDLCVDDMVLKNCHYNFTDNFFVCSSNQNYNIHDSIPVSAGITNINGAWAGPSALTGGYLGTFNPTLDLNGNYIYTFPISPIGRCFSDTADVSINTVICTGSCPILRLNHDTTVCKNSLVQLKAKLDTGFIQSVVWTPSWGLSNPNIYNPTTTVTKDTMYHVTVNAASPLTLIANGDFSLGNVSFTSSYIYCSATVPPGSCVQSWGLLSCDDYYTIGTCPHNFHSRFSTFGDHTTGSGNMMIVNGSIIAGTSVWCQTVPVSPNTNYTFSGWFTNVDSFSSSTNLPLWALEINGVQLATFSPSVTAGIWLHQTAVWNSGANTTASICIVDNAVNGGGNDFALDDLSFNMTCTLTDSVRVLANIAPTISLPKDSFLCNSVNVNIVPATTGKPLPTLAWQNGSTTSTFNATTLGTYWCDATNVCGTKRDSMKISLGSAPTSIDLGLHRTICNQSPYNLVPTLVSSTPVSYKWQDSTTVDTFKVLSNGLYFVRAYNNCGSVWDTVTLTLKTAPTVDLGATQTVCNQNSFVLNPTVTGSANLYYKWQDSTTTASYNATTSNTYFVRVYNECGSVWDTVSVNFNHSPTVDLGLRKSLCDSSHYLLTPLVTGTPTLNYKWQDSSANATFNAISSGIYFVRVYNQCGSVWDTTSVIFNFKPNVTLGKDTIICDATNFIIVANTTGNQPQSYAWNNGAISLNNTVQKTNNYILKATNFCGSDADTIHVSFMQSPTLTFAQHKIKECFVAPVVLNAITTGTKPLKYAWSNGSVDTSIVVSHSGKYILSVSNYCKTATDTVLVNLIPMPNKIYFASNFTICDDTFMYFNAQNNGSKFLWNTSDTSAIIKANQAGLYVVKITNQKICSVLDSVQLKTIDCRPGLVVIPNAFTPNNDGVDDVFMPILLDNAHLISFKIFNRWGQLIYATNIINKGWDGKFQGNDEEIGTYIFTVDYLNFDKPETLKGNVTLLR